MERQCSRIVGKKNSISGLDVAQLLYRHADPIQLDREINERGLTGPVAVAVVNEVFVNAFRPLKSARPAI
jgi:hypothetical protein